MQRYLSEPACVDGAPQMARLGGRYVDDLSQAIVSIIKEEVFNHRSGDRHNIASMSSFASIYTEMWRIAASYNPEFLKDQPDRVFLKVIPDNELIDRDALSRMNERWSQRLGDSDDEKEFIELVQMTSDGYLKALAELEISLDEPDPPIIKHHGALLGDILQELIALHALLLPLHDQSPTEDDLPESHPHH